MPVRMSRKSDIFVRGYLSNRAAFENFVCRFHYVEGSASSVDAAVNGKLTSPQPIEGIWIVAGQNVKYSLICDSETIEKTIQEAKNRHSHKVQPVKPGGMGFLPLPHFLGNEILKYGQYAINVGILSGANIVSLKEDTNFLEIRRTPWNMGIMGPEEVLNPGRQIKGYLKQEPDRVKYLGTKKVDGVECMVVQLRPIVEPHERLVEYYFDPRRGFLPILIKETDTSNGKVSRLAKILDVKHCSNDRWFPMKSVLMDDPEQKPFRVDRYEVLELDADDRPADDLFFLDLKKGTEVNIPGKQGPYLIFLDSPRRVFGRNLEALYNETIESGERQLAQRAAMTGQAYKGNGGGNQRLWIVAACVLAMLAVFGCVMIVRRRRRA